MNTKELIYCLKYCANDETDCLGCERWEYDCGSARCVDNLMELAADRLAALEAELIDERHRHDRYADYTRGLETKYEEMKCQLDDALCELKRIGGCGACVSCHQDYDAEPCDSCRKDPQFPNWKWRGPDGQT